MVQIQIVQIGFKELSAKNNQKFQKGEFIKIDRTGSFIVRRVVKS
jgi:hypothetical protein